MKKIIISMLAVVLALSVVMTLNISSKPEYEAEAEIDVSKLKVEDLLDMDALVGWATVDGEGLDTVVGGGQATPVLATDYETLSTLAGDNLPRVIIISGTIDTVGKTVDVGSNKTIIGIDENAQVIGGFNIKNACNVIISNLNIKGIWPATALPDGVNVEHSHHVWLDHLNIWDAPDGNLDIKGSSNYVTVSWCKFWYTDERHEHRLSNLVSSGTHNDATELHHLNVTYHHNWFADLIMQRMPRLLYGKGHIYNNYYTAKDNDYCIGVGCYASALIENNYFKDGTNPHQVMYEGTIACYITARGNIYDNTKGKKQSGYFKGSKEFTAMEPEEFDNPPYEYYPDVAEDVPAIVEAYAGPQNILEENPAKPSKAPAVTPYPEETEPVVTKEPVVFPTNTPDANDNPITYNEETGIYLYNGFNSDNSKGKLVVENPFSGMDLSESFTKNEEGYPVWENGVTVSYWVKLPETAVDIPVLNFNLADSREISMDTKYYYDTCKEAESGTGSYKLGTVATYYGMTGKLLTTISGQGRYSRFNPNYPDGMVYKIDAKGDMAAYSEGADLTKPESFITLTAYGEGYYKNYGIHFDEEGGENSLLSEAYIDGSLSLYASGSVGYARDNVTGRQLNPKLDDYGNVVDIDGENYFRYWGNGGSYTYRNGETVPTMAEKDQWHFVVTVIRNDWVQTYVDGIKLDEDYLNVMGSRILYGVAGTGFNMGYGSSVSYITKTPEKEMGYGYNILDLITDENTVLSIGGMGLGASKLRQSGIGTIPGSEVKDVRFYAVPLSDENIGETRVQTFTSGWKLEGTKLVEIEADSEPVPTIVPTDTPKPTDTVAPTPANNMGDVDMNGSVNAQDALEVLKHAAKISELEGESLTLADATRDNKIDAQDALKILKYAAKIIDEI